MAEIRIALATATVAIHIVIESLIFVVRVLSASYYFLPETFPFGNNGGRLTECQSDEGIGYARVRYICALRGIFVHGEAIVHGSVWEACCLDYMEKCSFLVDRGM